MAAKARKLYFDFAFTVGSQSQVFKLTEETATTPGDRFGALLEQLPALLGTSQPKNLQRNEISAIVVPTAQAADTSLVVSFLQGAGDASAGAAAPFLANSGTGTTVVAAKAGQSAVFVTNPRVMVSAPFVDSEASGTFRGTLIVQRQHSVEI